MFRLFRLRLFIFCSALFIFRQTSAYEYTVEDDVIVLTEDDFNRALKEFKHILIHFYVPWASNCKKVHPEFSEAAKILKEEGSEVRLAKIDVSEETDIAEEYKIINHPTVSLFQGGQPLNYQIVGRTAGDIVTFIKKKSGLYIEAVKTVEEINILTERNNVTVAGFFKNTESISAKRFLKIAKSLDHVSFVLAANQSLWDEYNIGRDTVVIFKSFDEGRVDLTSDLTEEGIQEFIDLNRLPLIIEFGPYAGQIIFELKIRNHAILLIRKDAEYFEERYRMFKENAIRYRGQVLFVLLDIDVEQNKKIIDFLLLKRSDCPTYRFMQLDDLNKYKPDKEVWSTEGIGKFVQAVLDEKIKPYFDSQNIPGDWDDGVIKILVGKNFDEVARDKTKDVFVEFYAPWDQVSKEFLPIWQKLGENFYKNPEVEIAKIDATQNEIYGIKMQKFPTLFFFPKNSDEVIEYTGELDLESLTSFVKSGGKQSKDENAKKEEL